MQFIKSEFKGLLPGYYLAGKNATRVVRTDMNDENKEEPSRYVSELIMMFEFATENTENTVTLQVDIDKCDYLVDMDTDSVTELEPTYSKHSTWTSIYSTQFLDARR